MLNYRMEGGETERALETGEICEEIRFLIRSNLIKTIVLVNFLFAPQRRQSSDVNRFVKSSKNEVSPAVEEGKAGEHKDNRIKTVYKLLLHEHESCVFCHTQRERRRILCKHTAGSSWCSSASARLVAGHGMGTLARKFAQ